VKPYYASIDHLMLLDQLAISAVIRHFQERMPYAPFVFGGGMPAPLSRDGARHWAVLPTMSPRLGRRWRKREDYANIVLRYRRG
jgi:hypothetical protein